MNNYTTMSGLVQPFANALQKFDDLNLHYHATPYEQLKKMTILERIKLYDWRFEAGIVGLLVFLFVIHWIGERINLSRANRLYKTLNKFLSEELKFTTVGIKDYGKPNSELKPFRDEKQKSWFFGYATGRSAIKNITIKTHMYARSNPFSILMENIFSFFFSSVYVKDIDEFLEITIKPNGVHVANENANINTNFKDILKNFKFITSIVNKTYMSESRQLHYFLSCTHITDNTNGVLPFDYVFMSDVNQLNKFIPHYSKKSLLEKTLKDSVDLLQFISFTDLPTIHPDTDGEFNKFNIPKAIIRTNIPTSQKEVDLITQMISIVVEVYDNVTRELVSNNKECLITPDILKKTTNLRNQEIASIVKEMKRLEMEAQREKKEEAEREMRRQNRGSEELAKKDQKMKEKRERRARNKQRVRFG